MECSLLNACGTDPSVMLKVGTVLAIVTMIVIVVYVISAKKRG